MPTDFNVLTGERELPQTAGSLQSKPDWVQLSEELAEKYMAAQSTWADQAREDDEFRNGVQWSPVEEAELIAKNQYPIVVNRIYPAVEQAKALLTSNKPRFTSTGREDSDTKLGALFADLLTYIWDISVGNMELKTAIDDYYVRGKGILNAYIDPHADLGKGEVKIRSLNPFDVFITPTSTDRLGRDAAHMLYIRRMSMESLVKWLPEARTVLQHAQEKETVRHPSPRGVANEGQQIDADVQTADARMYEVIDRYSKVKLPRYHVFDSLSGLEKVLTTDQYRDFLTQPAAIQVTAQDQKVLTKPRDVQKAQQLVEETGGTFHFRMNEQKGQPEVVPGPSLLDPLAIEGSDTMITMVTMEQLIGSGYLLVNTILVDRIQYCLSVGGVPIYKGIMEVEDYPIVPVYNRHHRNPYAGSDVRVVRPIQRFVNKTRSLIIAHASSSTNTKVFVPIGSVDEERMRAEWAKAGTGFIPYDAEFGIPVVAGPVPLPNELYKNEADASRDIEHILGVYALQQGDVSQAPATFKGTVAMDEYGQRRIRSKKDDIEAAINQLARVVVQLIQITYTERKVIRLLQPNNAPKELTINQPIYNDYGELTGVVNDVTTGKYDIVMVSGSMLPSNRWARFEYYMELYKNQLIDQVEVLKQTEVVDMEGVLNRFSEVAKLQGMVRELQAQVKKLNGDLQTAERESLHDRKRVEVEKFKTQLKSVSTRAEAAGTLYKERLNDELKQVRSELEPEADEAAADTPGFFENE